MANNSPEIDEEVNHIIRNHVALAVGGGLVPFPLIGMVAVTAIQYAMIDKIGEVFGQDVSEAQAKVWISALAGSTVARGAAEFLKIIPGIGLVSSVASGALSGATTYAVGKVIARHFSNGGTVHDFEAENFREYYQSQFQAGKSYAENVKDESNKKDAYTDTVAVAVQDDASLKLVELQKLREAGLITDEEYAAAKERVMSRF